MPPPRLDWKVAVRWMVGAVMVSPEPSAPERGEMAFTTASELSSACA